MNRADDPKEAAAVRRKERQMEQNETEEQLREWIGRIRPASADAAKKAQERWDSIAKPLHSLGRLEDAVVKLAGIGRTADVRTAKKALIVMCADNGVVAEGVTQTGQEVTAIVAENFLDCNSSAAIMCEKAGINLFPVDIGMARDTRVPARKIAYGTKNLAKEPAMTRKEAVRGILTGIQIVKEKKEEGYDILATGEMGIGNTTTSSAVAAILLDQPVEVMTGRGAGLTSEGLRRKKEVIAKAAALHQPDKNDAVDVLSKVGGFDLAGLSGMFLGGAVFGIPVVIDGFISAAAALLAVRMCSIAGEYMLASHTSKEPGMRMILDALGLKACLDCEMCLGEGTGAAAFLPVLDLAVEVYRRMSTFSENRIEEYKELGDA